MKLIDNQISKKVDRLYNNINRYSPWTTWVRRDTMSIIIRYGKD